jgi:phage tail sheath gpL-like
MPVSFNQIPSNLRVPLYWIEVDPSMAGLPTFGMPALLCGTKSSEGTAPPDVPLAIGSQAQADAAFGQGSELSRMAKAFFANNFANEVYALPVAEQVTGTAATGDIAITMTPTEAGTIHLYIGGEHVDGINVSSSDTPDDIATAIADAVNAQEDLPVTADAVVTSGTCTLTAKWKGVNGNDITVLVNYFGTLGGEQTPAGLVMTLPTGGVLAGGAGVPDWDNGIAALGEKVFEYVAMPYTDSNSLLAWEQEYGFEDVGRWGWMRQLYGHILTAKRDTYDNLLTWSPTRNSGVTAALGIEVESPSPVYEWAAAFAAKAQRAFINDPARPLQTLVLNQIKLAPLHSRFSTLEINSLAGNGIATQKAGSDNQPMISRETTTYQLNSYGTPDTAYELMTTLATLARLFRNQRQAITSKFARCKLANDGTRFGPGQAIVTPSIIKAELIAEYRMDMWNGLVEDITDFKANLLVERDPNDPNRVNVVYPPDLINQLRIFAVLGQFRLQYNANIDPIAGANIGVTGVLPGLAA